MSYLLLRFTRQIACEVSLVIIFSFDIAFKKPDTFISIKHWSLNTHTHIYIQLRVISPADSQEQAASYDNRIEGMETYTIPRACAQNIIFYQMIDWIKMEEIYLFILA